MSQTLPPPAAHAARGPVRARERALAPDLARGFMLLFIALANAGGVVFAATEPAIEPTPHGFESVVNFGMMMFVSGHAYPMFAVMFGYGLVQMSRRQREAGASTAAARDTLVRRNAWLIAFGAVHAVLLYFGDFLAAYGLVGIIAACLLLNRGDKFHRVIVWLWGLVLVEAAVFMALVYPSLSTDFGATPKPARVDSLAATSYGESLVDRLAEWPLHTASVLGFIFIVWLGMWAARRRVLEEPARHRPLLIGATVVGLGVGFLGSLPQALVSAGALSTDNADLTLLLHNLGGMYSGPGYVAAFGLIALWLTKNRAAPTDTLITGSLVALGRRSLSGYLFQSVSWFVLLLPFTFAMPQWFGNKTLLYLLVATATWLATVVTAAALQRRGHPGPAEALLRRLAYGPRR
ncbi:DUF418 domain-containing protein [Stackebrandtia nassauensis]|uniref:DUF418 domain-containing protein n=1 Tax=Stackebrandtia nassauensis (strain DSM 44728 / CIP 108903 / NRRL B-16338 / NBRC 102104 / LLR-40K-21) TaxID=446470 RepID=D3PXA9_STANL|nr:DUF418 domain-containing protein [Stackebrandtia nassauensis]ADD41372.1 protein of unknown function DUF405 [Stackebrandtia nassauensis DSM 44728]